MSDDAAEATPTPTPLTPCTRSSAPSGAPPGLPDAGRDQVAAEVDDLLTQLAGKGVVTRGVVQRQRLPARRRLPDLVDRADV